MFVVKLRESRFFYLFDLDFNPMTLVLDIDIVKVCRKTENEVPSFSGSKVIA